MFQRILVANRGEIALRVIRACRDLGIEVANVQAIHPGYGFLSENPHFAEVCRACKIEFIGPPQEAMRLLGNKNEARKLAQKAGVPVVPGSPGLITRDAAAV